jgi:small-conductance mechanosensitive channel
MTHHHDIVRELRRSVPRRRSNVLRALLYCALTAAVLVIGRTAPGFRFVTATRAFLEFYVGVFALLALTAAVVAGLVASWRFIPIRLRVLAQAAHRATAVMAMSFLAAHVLLKLLERHASVLAVAVPFAGARDRTLWVGLGTVASDMMIVIFATGVARHRFIGGPRAWTWRTVHIAAYLCWPIAIAHGLAAGRTPKDWVTVSYVVCFVLVIVAALAGLGSFVRRRGATRRRGGRPAEPPDAAVTVPDIPDEQFWAELKAEAAQWIGSRR